VLEGNKKDLGGNTSLVLDKDNVNKVKDLDKDFS
jgi:hypothetical protein